jgi:transcription-repair coupling factor (superfamily II helicase)
MSYQLVKALGESSPLNDQKQIDIQVSSAILPIALAYRAESKFLIVVTSSTRAEAELAQELRSLLGSEAVAQFPAWETLPHEKLSPQSDTVARRIETLHRIKNLVKDENKEKLKVVVTQIRSLLQPVISQGESSLLELNIGMQIQQRTLSEKLVAMAYRRVDLVEKRGDFAVRGGLVDLFPSGSHHPIRVDFFDEEIEEMKYFAISDQRSYGENLDNIVILPCRELLITDEVRKRAARIGDEFEEIRDLTSKIQEGIYLPGMESLSGALAENLTPFHTLIPKSSEIILIDSNRIRNRAIELERTDKEFLEAAWSTAANGGQTPINLQNSLESGSFYHIDEIFEEIESSGFRIRNFNSYIAERSEMAWQVDHSPAYKGKIEALLEDLMVWNAENYRIVIGASTNGLLKRYDE